SGDIDLAGGDRLGGEGPAAQLDEFGHVDAVVAEKSALMGDVEIDVVDGRRGDAGRDLDSGERLGAQHRWHSEHGAAGGHESEETTTEHDGLLFLRISIGAMATRRLCIDYAMPGH